MISFSKEAIHKDDKGGGWGSYNWKNGPKSFMDGPKGNNFGLIRGLSSFSTAQTEKISFKY